MSILKEIAERRSIRKFVPGYKIPMPEIAAIIEAARLAPSGSNTQPWRFVVVQDNTKIEELSKASLGRNYFGDSSCIVVCIANTKAKKDTEMRLKELARDGAFSEEEVDYFVSVLRKGVSSASDEEYKGRLKAKIDDLQEGHFSADEVRTLYGLLAVDLKAMSDEAKATRDTAIAIYSMMLQATSMGLGSCWIMINDKDIVKNQINLSDPHYSLIAMLALGKPAEDPPARPRYSLEEIVYFEEWGVPCCLK